MSKKILVLFLIVLFTTLQSTILNYVRIFRCKPDILLILVIFFSLNFGRIYGLVVGLVCGLFSEATSGIPSGVAISVYSLVGLSLGYIGRWVYKQRIFGLICTSFLTCFFAYLILSFVFGAFTINFPVVATLIHIVVVSSVFTACVSLFFYRFLESLLPNGNRLN